MDTGDIVLATIERPNPERPDAGDRLIVAVREYEGKRYVDLRVHFMAEDGAFRPTKKGVTVRRRELEEVGKALQQAARVLGEGGR
jgi:hypothetical protein